MEGMASEFDGDASEATTNSSGQGTSGHDIEDTLEGIRFIMDYDKVVIDHKYCKDSAVNAQDIVVAEVSQNESIKEDIDNQCSSNSPALTFRHLQEMDREYPKDVGMKEILSSEYTKV
nr:unnamed protein product [Callosobruchus analis]